MWVLTRRYSIITWYFNSEEFQTYFSKQNNNKKATDKRIIVQLETGSTEIETVSKAEEYDPVETKGYVVF